MAGREEDTFAARYARGIRTSVRNNAAAYGYSAMITGTLAVLSTNGGTPATGEVFLFLLGAVSAFTIVEGVASGGFRQRLRGEPAEVVALGSALSFPSVGAGVGVGAIADVVLDDTLAWPIGAFGATLTYLVVVAVEMALAERAAPIRRESAAE